MLELKGICKTFNAGTVNEKTALNSLNLSLKDGDFVTVIGGNGAGKSTMLNAVAGVFPVDEGTITVDGVNVTRLPEYKRAKYMGRVFQDPMTGTAANMQIEENLALAARRGSHRTLRPGISQKERELSQEKLKILGLGIPHDQQGGPSLRRPAPGPHPAYGHPKKPQAPASGRAHGSP